MDPTEKILKFKTNINCAGCVAKVSPWLNESERIGHWDVDTRDANKILTVQTNGITPETIIEKVREAGFKIELFQ